MRNKIITSFFCLLLAVSALIGLLMPDRYYSEREKRTLTQKPKFTVADFISGKFSDNLESYLTDQVPLRDDRVTLKTYLELAVGKRESGGIYLCKDQYLMDKFTSYSKKQLAANDCKVWCIHLPYGSTTAARNRDLCAAGADRAASVAFFTRAIRAVAPLKPKNVLVHCNQTLVFGDGSSAASLALSLHELQTVADEIGAHVCVENMSYGVGADAAVLAAAVDEANALGSHRHEVRIAFDTGHANLYLTREQPGKTVVDWLRTAGARIGQLHIHGNRGWNGRINDDHLMPGYAGRLGYADAIGRAGLWGEFYHTLLAECRYRGPFTYEISTRTFGTVAGEERSDNVSAPWTIAHNYDTYLYPAFREYANRK